MSKLELNKIRGKKANDQMVKAVKERRLELNLTQEYVAYQLGISQNAYSKIELFYTELTVARLAQIAAILETSIVKLLSALP